MFDKVMGLGTISLIGMLFLITTLVVLVTGILCSLLGSEGSVGNMIWMSFMHTMDSGTLAGDDTSDLSFLVLMTIVTICGIFVTSILIGIISSGFEEKLTSLRKGFSKIIESNHTVVIGYNESLFTILTELIEANSNHKKSCIVVIGQEEKEVMDEQIRNQIKDFKTTSIMCRNGKPMDETILEMVSLETARSVIINEEDDFTVIKSILAIVTYLKNKQAMDGDLYITALIHQKENLEAARIATQGKGEIIFLQDMITRILANTCRQPGLSNVLIELFGFDGDEVYFEYFPELIGKKFGDVLNLFEHSIVMGICKGDKPYINPPMDTVFEEGDRVIHLAEDDGVAKPMAALPDLQPEAYKTKEENRERNPFKLLILGCNEQLSSLLEEFDDFLDERASITIAADELCEEIAAEASKHAFAVKPMELNIYSLENLKTLVHEDTKNILLLNDDTCSPEDSDQKIALLLLQIRSIIAEHEWNINITSEMNLVENQKLMQVANVNDFVVGSTITSLISTQISENRHLLDLFIGLLISEGSEFYMKPAQYYVQLNKEIDFYTLTEIVKERNEILMGIKRVEKGQIKIILNPLKSESFVLTESDYMVVLAEE